jgi:hypothetical protein
LELAERDEVLKRKKMREEGIAIHLTESQKTVLEEAAHSFDDNMSMLGRRLIQYLLSGKVTLEVLLRKYQSEVANLKNKYNLRELRSCKFVAYIGKEEKQALIALADQGFYLPGEVARILVELFLAGIIREEDIQKVAQSTVNMG